MTGTVNAQEWTTRLCPPGEGGCGENRLMPVGWSRCGYCRAEAPRRKRATGRPAGRPRTGAVLPGLRAARGRAGVTVPMLTEQLRVGRGTLYAYERLESRASWPAARAVAEVLGVPVEELTDA